ncbi:2-keto-4-pentenoate hydratase/2-oxohepta-3-ene-1,7-dioic acid hydratase [Desulfitobacterium dichloroeliminans LMG P-21439]|uniref:2-keto-4-pentenoate hydratase/2-oxohepta-3-ene-1,7-dioic acid hydratase n=1 Tax=Desulfitobacterium dichloroeliminans (strain LMG P-21439 / DCA1) TaxID=871963 RepID=L0F560_DESDL|nr:fumarylacetoacetate hydrolase family protein [Desulfitobacterium dichloroeliminans]AGA68327.1 2-keto-4-pentenoate hydratase/2-oxohepta-3-ene-1,7-dioic acid hydratase [Desulfitobacterium dichloroeliminans LMG P-21439]
MVIKNIYCVGRNYMQHAKELNNAVPTSPFLFAKPTHALVEGQGQTISMPQDQGDVHYEVEFVVHISEKFEPDMKAEELIDKIAIGIDFTLREVQDELKEKGLPWLLAKGFPNSAVLSQWLPFEGLGASANFDFTLEKNGIEVQRGNIKEMIFDIPTIIEFSAKHFGLDEGDIIYTGTPSGVGKAGKGDRFVLKWKEEKVGELLIGD